MGLDERHNTGPLLVGVTGMLLFLSTISVAARCYNQIFLLKRFQIEDWLAVLTWMVFAVFTGFCCAGVYYGLGARVVDVPVRDRPRALFFKYLGMTTYVAASGLIKFVVGLYLVKLFAASRQRWQTRFLWTLLGTVGVINTAYFFISIFQCKPIERFWLQNDPDWPKQGRCLKTWLALASTYTVNIVNIIADAALAVMPISLVWKAKMDRRTKWSVVAILSVGSAASICTVIRVPYVYQLLANKEYLANFIELGAWSAAEIGLAIIASSAATLRPLFKKLRLLQETLVHRSRRSGHSRSRSMQLFSRDRKNSTGNALGCSAHDQQQTPKLGSKGHGGSSYHNNNNSRDKNSNNNNNYNNSSFGASTYGTDTKISFSQALGSKKSYATLGGDTLNDTMNGTLNDTLHNDDTLVDAEDAHVKRRSSPILVRTTISVDIEKADMGDDREFTSPSHPRYHTCVTTIQAQQQQQQKQQQQQQQQHPTAGEHRRSDSEERLIWDKRERQAHQFHIPYTHQRTHQQTHHHQMTHQMTHHHHHHHQSSTHQQLLTRTWDQELADLDEVSVEESNPRAPPPRPPRPPRSPFPMISPTFFPRMPASPRAQPGAPHPSYSFPSHPSPPTSPPLPVTVTTQADQPEPEPEPEPELELQQPKPTHQPPLKQHQGSLLPIPPERESEARRLSCPM